MPSAATRDRAFETLHALLDKPDMPFSGWTIPIEPLLDASPQTAGVSAGYRQARRARPLRFSRSSRRFSGPLRQRRITVLLHD